MIRKGDYMYDVDKSDPCIRQVVGGIIGHYKMEYGDYLGNIKANQTTTRLRSGLTWDDGGYRIVCCASRFVIL